MNALCNVKDVAIRFDHVGKIFSGHGTRTEVLKDVSFSIFRGEVFGIVGPSGAGKSTLIRLMNRLERPSAGAVTYDGDDLAALSGPALAARRRKIGMIFQAFGLLSAKTARENVRYALDLAHVGTKAARQRKADALLDRVGLGPHADKYPAQLSGGQKQRVAIARALANDPDMLLCDEATSALDPEATEEVLHLIASLNRDLGLTVVVVTHEMDVVRRLCDRVAVLQQGQLAEVGAVADVLLFPRSAEAKRLSRSLLPAPPSAGRQPLRLIYFADAIDSNFLSTATAGLDASIRILAGHVAALKTTRYWHLIVDVGGRDRAQAILRLKSSRVRIAEDVDG